MKLLSHVGNEEIRRCEAKTEESRKAVVMGIEQSPCLSCQCSASALPVTHINSSQGTLSLTTIFVIFISEHPNFIVILLHTNWYLFTYSRFAYFRPKSGVSPTCKQNYIWTSK